MRTIIRYVAALAAYLCLFLLGCRDDPESPNEVTVRK
jgi:hypothetical protein